MDSEEAPTLVNDHSRSAAGRLRDKIEFVQFFILRSQFNLQNGAQQMKEVDDDRRTNHKKRTKDCFLYFCDIVLQHEREILSEVSNLFAFYLFLFSPNF